MEAGNHLEDQGQLRVGVSAVMVQAGLQMRTVTERAEEFSRHVEGVGGEG